MALLKASYYTVSEKCQDGWYKGTCLRTGRSGVFPGNYVQMVRLSAAMKSSMASALLASLRSPGTASAVTSHSVVGRTHSFPKTSPHHKAPSSSSGTGGRACVRTEQHRSAGQGTPGVKAPSRTITNVTTAHTRTVRSTVTSAVSLQTDTITTSTCRDITNAAASARRPSMTPSVESDTSSRSLTSPLSAASSSGGVIPSPSGAGSRAMSDSAAAAAVNSCSPKAARRRHRKHDRSKHLSMTSSPRFVTDDSRAARTSSCDRSCEPVAVAGVIASAAVAAASPSSNAAATASPVAVTSSATSAFESPDLVSQQKNKVIHVAAVWGRR